MGTLKYQFVELIAATVVFDCVTWSQSGASSSDFELGCFDVVQQKYGDIQCSFEFGTTKNLLVVGQTNLCVIVTPHCICGAVVWICPLSPGLFFANLGCLNSQAFFDTSYHFTTKQQTVFIFLSPPTSVTHKVPKQKISKKIEVNEIQTARTL